MLLFVALLTLLLPRRAVLGMAETLGPHQRVAAARHLRHQGRVSRPGEDLPQGPLIVAAKHQSTWETFALLRLFDDPPSSSSAS